MAQYATEVEFKCPSCSENVEVLVEISPPNWAADKAIDRMVQEEVTLACPECGGEFDADVTNSDNQIDMRLNEHPETVVSCEMGYDRAPDYEDEWDLPASPATELRHSIVDALRLLDAHGTESSVSSVNRMVFISCFAAFEAFLSDTMLKYVLADDDALRRLLTQEAELQKVKIDLITILEDEEIVFSTVTNHLKGLLWHNLSKVDAIYHIAAKFSIFDDAADKALLFRALPIRHDCVHRNGRDKDGNIRVELKKKFVEDLAQAMLAIAVHVDGSIKAQTK